MSEFIIEVTVDKGTHAVMLEVGQERTVETETGIVRISVEGYPKVVPCRRCRRPMVFTFEFVKHELFCPGCSNMEGILYGMWAGIESTPTLRQEHAEIEKQYELDRDLRKAAQ